MGFHKKKKVQRKSKKENPSTQVNGVLNFKSLKRQEILKIISTKPVQNSQTKKPIAN